MYAPKPKTPGTTQTTVVLLLGIAAGLILGYMLMGTAHAVSP